jgi:hypothetical protein
MLVADLVAARTAAGMTQEEIVAPNLTRNRTSASGPIAVAASLNLIGQCP